MTVERVQISKIVEPHAKLESRGGGLFAGICPFCGDRRFNVSDQNNQFRCFDCGANGDAINFAMRIFDLDFLGAVEYLAKPKQTPQSKELPSPAARLREMLEALEAHRNDKSEARPPGEAKIELVAGTYFTIEAPWRARMKRAAEDGVQESLRASIREEGWLAFAIGGLAAMHSLADAACGQRPGLLDAMLDHSWDGIGLGDEVWVA
jgi:CHC2 zinc finger